ncbi:PDZ domain-containing protein [Streptomyces sp. G5(2025)]|uniref:PDZ domain-containing protein n=1 Tax=Streptomyces sp. G5(2025) TaxID=3406628 RepID=UPI003C24ADFB
MDQSTLRPKPLPGRGTGGGSGESPGQSPCRDPEDHPDTSGRPRTERRRGRRPAAVLSGVLLAVLLVLSGIGIGTVGKTVAGVSAFTEMRRPTPSPDAAQPLVNDDAPARQPEAPKPGAGIPGAPKPGAAHSHTPRAPKPGAASPGAATPGAANSGVPKPGAVNPGAPRHGAAKPVALPPAASKSGRVQPAGAATLGVEAVDAPAGPGGRRGSAVGALIVGVHMPGPGHSAGLVRGDTVLRFGRTRVGSAADLASAVAAARPGKEVTLTVRHKDGTRQTLPTRPGVVT